MARTVAQIQAQILTQIAMDPNLPIAIRVAAANADPNAVLSTSRRAIWNLFAFIVSVAQGIEEQLMDQFKIDLETIAASIPPGTPEWVQAQVLLFQYDQTNPQIIQLNNLVPSYPQIITADQIISRCSVTTDLSGTVTIKVATGNPPGALNALQLAALQAYFNANPPGQGVGFAGITYNCMSANPDQLYLAATINYQGAYSSVIKATVISAITNYLAQFSIVDFNGNLFLSQLYLTTMAVPGVIDVKFLNVGARQDASALSISNLVSASQWVNQFWTTVAGYIIPEVTAGNTLSDTLIFNAQ